MRKAAVVLFVLFASNGIARADDEIKAIFKKYDNEKNELTFEVDGKEMTLPLAKDAKVQIGDKNTTPKELKVKDPIIIIRKKVDEKYVITEIRVEKRDKDK